MKTLIAAVAAITLTACNCNTLTVSQVAYRVDQCNQAQMDYNIDYNDKGKIVDVVCYKPGSPPPGSKYPTMNTTVPATNELEYVQ